MFNLIRKCSQTCTKFLYLPNNCRFINKLKEYRHFHSHGLNKLGNESFFLHNTLQINNKCRVLRGEQNEWNTQPQKSIADVDFNQKCSSLSTDDILRQFRDITRYCTLHRVSISDKRFDSFVEVVEESCNNFTDQQLIAFLQILIHHSRLTSPSFKRLWSAVDSVCEKRLNGWDREHTLYICDHWYLLALGKVNTFNGRAILKICKEARNLEPHQLLQLMFYLNVRRSPGILDVYDIETRAMTTIDSLSVDEIAVLCMGFFKTQTIIRREDLVATIYNRLIRDIDTVQDLSITCILKVSERFVLHN